jgi:hypothetical protein
VMLVKIIQKTIRFSEIFRYAGFSFIFSLSHICSIKIATGNISTMYYINFLQATKVAKISGKAYAGVQVPSRN